MKQESKPSEIDSSPRLLLFLSVDVVGSTAYKNKKRQADAVHPWVPVFYFFYRDFEGFLFRAIADAKKKLSFRGGYTKPEIWKRLGDELIFTVELAHNKHPLLYISAFREALNEYDRDLARRGLPLSLKGTAWIAGFPVKNVRVPIPKRWDDTEEPDEPQYEYDFIGPSIDLGFRLSKFADHRKIVLSVGLAWMLTKFTTAHLSLYFDGREHLKGVPPTAGYPIFWASRKIGGDTELRLRGVQQANYTDIHNYCEEFFADPRNETGKPFIENDSEFNEKSDDYDEMLQNARKLYTEIESAVPDSFAEAGDSLAHKQVVTEAGRIAGEAIGKA